MRATSICAVMADAQGFDGKDVLVEGVLWVEPHGVVFGGESCAEKNVRLDKTVDYQEMPDASRALNRVLRGAGTNRVDVVYEGKFHIVKGMMCSESHCFDYSIDVSKLVAARAPQ